jgi:hypothetical protein
MSRPQPPGLRSLQRVRRTGQGSLRQQRRAKPRCRPCEGACRGLPAPRWQPRSPATDDPKHSAPAAPRQGACSFEGEQLRGELRRMTASRLSAPRASWPMNTACPGRRRRVSLSGKKRLPRLRRRHLRGPQSPQAGSDPWPHDWCARSRRPSREGCTLALRIRAAPRELRGGVAGRIARRGQEPKSSAACWSNRGCRSIDAAGPAWEQKLEAAWLSLRVWIGRGLK